METDMSDTLTGTSVALRVLKLFHHQLLSRIGDRLDRHSHRYICHLSSPTTSHWRQTWQTLSQVHLSSVITYHIALETDLTETLTGTSVICHHLPSSLGDSLDMSRPGDRLDRHSHRYICSSPSFRAISSSTTTSHWRQTWHSLSHVHLSSVIIYHLIYHSHRCIYSRPSSKQISPSTTISVWRQTWQTLSQVHLSSFITYHLALETDMTDGLTGISALQPILEPLP